MKKNFANLTLILLLFFIFISLFTKSNIINSSIEFSINLFFKNIFPSLFPMFILTSIFTFLGFPNLIGFFFNKLFFFLFKTNSVSSYVFISSLLGGYPSNSKIIKELLDKNKLNESEASKILNFTCFPNPLFVINTVGFMFLNNKTYGYLILISILISNIIVGIIYRNLYQEKAINNYFYNVKDFFNNIKDIDIKKEFLQSIEKALYLIINIFGIITFCILFINLIDINVNPFVDSLFKGLIEVSTGLKYLSLTNIPINLKVIMTTFLLSFGGICIHLQIFNLLSKYKIKYYPFLLSRFIGASISSFIIYLIINI